MSIFDFFGKDPRSLFLEYSPADTTWGVVSWNFDLKKSNERSWSLEVFRPHQESIEWTRGASEEVRFFKNKKNIRTKKVSTDKGDLHQLMNLCIHSTLKTALENNHDFLLSPVTGANTLDYQNEAKALQWIQASFGTLTKALDRIREQKDLILTAAIFAGTEPESGLRVLRILVLNLDIFCYFQDDLSLRIAIFDDKNFGHGETKAPTFQQIIKVTKPQIYDEIVKLVHRIATVGEIR